MTVGLAVARRTHREPSLDLIVDVFQQAAGEMWQVRRCGGAIASPRNAWWQTCTGRATDLARGRGARDLGGLAELLFG